MTPAMLKSSRRNRTTISAMYRCRCWLLLLFCVLLLSLGVGVSGFEPVRHKSSDDFLETREVKIKQGRLKGVVYGPSTNRHLRRVEVYLGIQYAAPPVGKQRFMPPQSPLPWSGTKRAVNHGHVCPQRLPDINAMTVPEGRKKYLGTLMAHVHKWKQNEDCLYLNIYAPYQDNPAVLEKYPVMVFIHGESFEWNSGNAYDGSSLASNGHVVVVTFNYRLGILGFLGPVGPPPDIGNLGLLDQLAALKWVKDNIEVFGGDSRAVTIMGHSTGAACASLLLASPVADAEPGLFHRAILMSGTAFADWAVTRSPLDSTIQVADALNCPATAGLLSCLRRRRLADIVNVTVHAPHYLPALGPVVDGKIVPNVPAAVVGKYDSLFGRYELLYGVTQTDVPTFPDGLTQQARTDILTAYLRELYPGATAVAVASTLKTYNPTWQRRPAPGPAPGAPPATPHGPSEHALLVLAALSDARLAAPMLRTAEYHSAANPASYMYVFGHRSRYGYYSNMSLAHSVPGEELPYVFGAPIDGGPHAPHSFTPDEELLSEAIVRYWTNFARTGNPNEPHRNSFPSQAFREWRNFDVRWPPFDVVNQSYLMLGIVPRVGHGYRRPEMEFWNRILPETVSAASRADGAMETAWEGDYSTDNHRQHYPYYPPERGYRPEVTSPTRDPNDEYVIDPPHVHIDTPGRIDHIDSSSNHPHHIDTSSIALTIVIVIGICFFLVNLCAFAGLYYQRDKLKEREEIMKRKYEDLTLIDSEKSQDIDCKKSMPSKKIVDAVTIDEDDYEAIRGGGGGGHVESRKMIDSRAIDRSMVTSRECSASTIDANTKVREWMVNRFSPRCVRSSKKRDGNDMTMTATKTLPSCSSVDNVNTSIDRSIDNQQLNGEKSMAIPVKSITTKKSKKISVAVDATPAANRDFEAKKSTMSIDSPHMSRSMDHLQTCVSTSSIVFKKSSLKRSATTVDDLSSTKSSTKSNNNNNNNNNKDKFRRSTTNINLQVYPASICEKSTEDISTDDVRSIWSPGKDEQENRCRNLYPRIVNISLESKNIAKNNRLEKSGGNRDVTSSDDDRDDGDVIVNDIKKRNFPKVLPDLPQQKSTISADDRSTKKKRRSLPSTILPEVHGLSPTDFSHSVEASTKNIDSSQKIAPPPPPPRISSSIVSKQSTSNNNHPTITMATNNASRIEPRVIIKPISKTPVGGKPTMKTKNNQPIPRVTPNVDYAQQCNTQSKNVQQCKNVQQFTPQPCKNVQQLAPQQCKNVQQLAPQQCKNVQQLAPQQCKNVQQLAPQQCKNVQQLAPQQCKNVQQLAPQQCKNVQQLAPQQCKNVQQLAPQQCKNVQQLAPQQCKNVQQCNTMTSQPCVVGQPPQQQPKMGVVAGQQCKGQQWGGAMKGSVRKATMQGGEDKSSTSTSTSEGSNTGTVRRVARD